MTEIFPNKGKELAHSNRRLIIGVLLKTSVILLALNIIFALINPVPWIGRITAYNLLFPGRLRLPFGERPDKAYNLSLLQLDAMFASHVLARTTKQENEYRVFLVGDSNTWGFFLRNDETLASQLNALALHTPDGRSMRFYNFGYPTISLTKDLLIMDQVQRFDPDMIIWLVTLEAFPREKQLFTPLVQHNPGPVRRLIDTFQLESSPEDPAFEDLTFWQRTIIGQRRTLADMIRHQIYGTLWAATGIDQDIPQTYTLVQADLSDEEVYYGMQPPIMNPNDLAFDVLHAGIDMMGKRPVLLINEPMYISQGENSDIRYNFYYPRWAYDEYRRFLVQESKMNSWNYLDAWDIIEPEYFTNSAIHLNAEATQKFAQFIGAAILEVLEGDVR